MDFLEDASDAGGTSKADEISAAQDEAQVVAQDVTQVDTSKPTTMQEGDSPRVKCPGVALADDETRMISSKYPTLNLIPRETDIVRHHLFKENGINPNSFYAKGTLKFDVISNNHAEINGGESGMNEMEVMLSEYSSNKMCNYEAGDHLVIYPVNSQCVVEALLDNLDVDRHAIISVEEQPKSYPFPTGLTVYETLSHCTDLGALVSPNFARMILQGKDIDYKAENIDRLVVSAPEKVVSRGLIVSDCSDETALLLDCFIQCQTSHQNTSTIQKNQVCDISWIPKRGCLHKLFILQR
jgi:sulfite reductase alpha subunit-like flavoprotein